MKTIIKAGLRALVFFTPFASPATAGPWEDAYNRGDYATAVQELRPPAKQGNAQAQYNLGVMYHRGLGVPQDYREAVRWFRKAAEQGSADAQNNLGAMYGNGLGVSQDHREAVRWYSKAAEQGSADAQGNLGVMYGNGKGVTQDYVLSHMWLNLAVSRFLASEKENRDKAIKDRDIVAGVMTPAQIAAAQKLAREWKPK